jgi:periplasmic divalent cation tolerance protein
VSLSSSFVIVLSTFPADQDPIPLAKALIEERLAACVNVLPPMRSVYRWEGKVEQADELQLVIKTSAARMEAVKSRLANLHPYDVPEVLVVPVSDGAHTYLNWIVSSTS